MSLVIDSVSKNFGSLRALDAVSFSVPAGSIFGLLGANGAGKTTCMRVVLDILRPDAGSVTWNGQSNLLLPRHTWGYLPEERGLYPRMHIRKQLRYFASLYGVGAARANAVIDEWLDRFHIPEAGARRAEELSKGNQQKIQFIAAIIHDPEVLIMDEPFSGLDPLNVALLKEAFVRMATAGKTLIFSTHYMSQIEELCEEIALIDAGRVVLSGSLADIKRNMNRSVLRLATSGGDSAALEARLSALPNTRLTNRNGYYELGVESDFDTQSVLQAALATGAQIQHFAVNEPSLEEVFLAHVGRSSLTPEEQGLAPTTSSLS